MSRATELMFEPRGTARPAGYGIRKRGRPVTYNDVTCIESSVCKLRLTVYYLSTSGAHHAAARVRAALKSTQGALNHARATLARQTRAESRS